MKVTILQKLGGLSTASPIPSTAWCAASPASTSTGNRNGNGMSVLQSPGERVVRVCGQRPSREPATSSASLDRGPIDWEARARQKDLQEICEAATKASLSQEKVRETVDALQTLLPGFHPSLFSMKASTWATMLQDTPPLVAAIIAMKSAYPGVDASAVFSKSPRLLTSDPAALEADAAEVRALLQPLDESQVSSIVQAVPSLCCPHALARALGLLRTWDPAKDPVQSLAADPTQLLKQGEADAPDSAEYGEDGKRAGCPEANFGKYGYP